ncbi:DIBOA-glucoside dioxygenase BX6-like [Panicum miliaceum]|uniref:DIBOA-glucoside dioxygenase BX6-like n=1 Tax=Panicum miliaceum TaxID=4540 RepID=A0A3L6TTY4_PANMI|nr:DIBOA-glucoside dioxygenase BX6-like [Panicum miliaceum]
MALHLRTVPPRRRPMVDRTVRSDRSRCARTVAELTAVHVRSSQAAADRQGGVNVQARGRCFGRHGTVAAADKGSTWAVLALSRWAGKKTVPVVDLLSSRAQTPWPSSAPRHARAASFFHVTNHRVPAGIVAAAAAGAFHEQPLAARSAFYSLHPVGSVAYSTVPITQRRGVVDAPILPWRDSLRVRFFGPGEPELGSLPARCRDALHMVSNVEFQSVEHRVVIKSNQDARVSIAVFFNPAKRGDSDRFGPLPELVTAEGLHSTETSRSSSS